jgi:ABC-type polysaccharide/polyol phosphate transport system ATPase subunit
MSIRVANLCKEYPISPLSALAVGLSKSHSAQAIRALSEVGLEARPGQVIGLMGPNGSGKSTLLKILAGVCLPSSGGVKTKGAISAVLDVYSGLNPQLTGRENIRRNLCLTGFSNKTISSLEPEIINFAELGEFMDQRALTYSNGMAARLTFAIATAQPADIMLLDELLVVGDEYFQGKCYARFKQLCNAGSILIMASHNIHLLERFCDHALWLDKGRVRQAGPPHQVGMSYLHEAFKKEAEKYPRKKARIERVEARADDSGQLRVKVDILRREVLPDLHLQVGIHDARLGILASLINTSKQGICLPPGQGILRSTVRLTPPPGLGRGLVAVVLAQGSGRIPGSSVEDAWGWANNKTTYFDMPGNNAPEPYLGGNLKWRRCA